MRKIYLASSWKNIANVRGLAYILREHGHQVFDFTNPENRQAGLDNYVFNAHKEFGKEADTMNYRQFMCREQTKRAFLSDKAGIDWADTLILIVPSGLSSHLEAGYARGCNKEVIIFGNLPMGQHDIMYGFSTEIFFEHELTRLLTFLENGPFNPPFDFY